MCQTVLLQQVAAFSRDWLALDWLFPVPCSSVLVQSQVTAELLQKRQIVLGQAILRSV